MKNVMRTLPTLLISMPLMAIANAQDIPSGGQKSALPPPISLEVQEGTPVSITKEAKKKGIAVEEIPGTSNTGQQAYEGLNPRHQACILAIKDDVDTGRIAAEQWLRDGGGPLASHCLAVADLAAGFPRLAAIRLQSLAEQENAGDVLTRARLFAQASEILLSTDQIDAASNALGQAFSLAPEAGELFLLSGKINHAQQKWQPVIDAISEAKEQGFYSSTGYANRARALKELTRFDDAAEDVAQSLRIDPFNLDALVLRGELAQTGIFISTNFRRAPSQAEGNATNNKSIDSKIQVPSLKPTAKPEEPMAIEPGEIDLTVLPSNVPGK